MSEEEVKEEVQEEKQEEAKPEQEESVKTASRKKVNRLSREDLDKKIASLDEKGLSGSQYYRHLQARKQEMEARG
jgi:hypothetical protein